MARKENTIEFFQVDAFTSERFRGNPAAVCLPEDRLPDSVCQAIAAEFNLSETAFIHSVERKADDIPRFGLRWFTPAREVDLCGHATLATAKVLFSEIGVDSEVLAFDTRSGALFAHRDGTAVRLDFPSNPSAPVDAPPGLLPALGLDTAVNIEYSPTTCKVIVEVAEEGTVREMRPDFRALLDLDASGLDVMGVIVTARGGTGVYGGLPPDFISRFFAPRVGVDEDPVTGAAHTVLAPYWAGRLGKDRMTAIQVSKRGGILGVHLDGDRVHLTGEAVVVMEGVLRLG